MGSKYFSGNSYYICGQVEVIEIERTVDSYISNGVCRGVDVGISVMVERLEFEEEEGGYGNLLIAMRYPLLYSYFNVAHKIYDLKSEFIRNL